MILAGDIGGTKTNLAYFRNDDQAFKPIHLKSYPSKDDTSLLHIIRKFTREFDEEISDAAFGIAGPVVEGRCEATNLPWIVDTNELADELGLNNVGLINDLEATAYGALRLQDDDKFTLRKGEAIPEGTIAIIAAGTGLGEGALVWHETRYLTLASEGGHGDFAPRNELEMEILRFMLERYDRVSYERLLSGPGVYCLYEYFRSKADYPEPEWLAARIKQGDPSAAVSEAGLNGKDKAASEALDMFVTLYGAEAGNLALKVLSKGGLFIGGGIAPKILPKLKDGKFLQAFSDKGRLSTQLEDMPVSVILNDKTALLGSAHFALMMRE